MANITAPAVIPSIDRYNYVWADIGVNVEISRLDENGHCELRVTNNGDKLYLVTQVNLLSNRSVTDIAKRLKSYNDIVWEDILTMVTAHTVDEMRKGEPVVDVGMEPETMALDYLLTPILERNQPTTIYASGASAKTMVADAIAVAVQSGVVLFENAPQPWVPTQGNVLYLDWEASYREHSRRVWAIKQGLKKNGVAITGNTNFKYRFCTQPLANELAVIQKIISENEIVLTIIDSQMPASGLGQDIGQVATAFYNAVRRLRCTTLIIDHKSKSDIYKGEDSVGQIGSVVKYNRSRSVFELWKSPHVSSNYIELSLRHKKFNEGRLLDDTGIRIQFNKNENNILESVEFIYINPLDSPDLAGTTSLVDRIDYILNSPMTTDEITEEVNSASDRKSKKDTVRTTLNKYAKGDNPRFVKLGERWGRCLDRRDQ